MFSQCIKFDTVEVCEELKLKNDRTGGHVVYFSVGMMFRGVCFAKSRKLYGWMI